MTTPKPEATMPAIAEALAERTYMGDARAIAGKLRQAAQATVGSRSELRLRDLLHEAADGIMAAAGDAEHLRAELAALRADPTAGDRGSGAPLTGTGSREPSPAVSASGFDPSRDGGRP